MVWVDLNASIMPNYKVARGICGGFMNYAPWKIEIWTFSNHKQRFSKKFIIHVMKENNAGILINANKTFDAFTALVRPTYILMDMIFVIYMNHV